MLAPFYLPISRLVTVLLLLCTTCLAGQTERDLLQQPAADTLQLQAFTASRSGSPYIVLEWNSYPERDNDHYLLERSLDGANFTVVGKVTGHGTTRLGHGYNFFDCAGTDATVFYRLTQVDFGGSLHRSLVLVAAASRIDMLPTLALSVSSVHEQAAPFR